MVIQTPVTRKYRKNTCNYYGIDATSIVHEWVAAHTVESSVLTFHECVAAHTIESVLTSHGCVAASLSKITTILYHLSLKKTIILYRLSLKKTTLNQKFCLGSFFAIP